MIKEINILLTILTIASSASAGQALDKVQNQLGIAVSATTNNSMIFTPSSFEVIGNTTNPSNGATIKPIDLLIVVPETDGLSRPTIGCTNQSGNVKTFTIDRKDYCATLGLQGTWFASSPANNIVGELNAARQTLKNTTKNSLYNYRVVGVIVAPRESLLFTSISKTRRDLLMSNPDISYYRNMLKADVVISMIDNNKPDGLANIIYTEAEAFITISFPLDKDITQPILAHEMGHVLGLGHDPQTIKQFGNQDTFRFPYAVGSYSCTSVYLERCTPEYGDIMSYMRRNASGYVRELRYSALGEFSCGPNGNSSCSTSFDGIQPDAKRAIFGNNNNGDNGWTLVSNYR